MKLKELKTILAGHPECLMQLTLPAGDNIPVSFHITEVGYIQKQFIDCGGTYRESKTCQIQIWVGLDEEHRLSAGKAGQIIDKAMHFLPTDDLEVELEYEDQVISQYPIAGCHIAHSNVVINLRTKHTDCLAKELCGVESPASLKVKQSSCCGAKSNCC